MPFYPSIQSFVGAHSGGAAIGIDWTRDRVFEINNTHLSRYGLLTGLEEAFTPLADMGGVGENGVASFIGVAANGDIFLSATGSLYNGASMTVDGTALTMLHLVGYPPPNFGQGGMDGLTFGSTQYYMDRGLGNNVVPVLNRINANSLTTWLGEQSYAAVGGAACAGPVGLGTWYVLSAPNSGGTQTGPAYLNVWSFDGAGFVSNVNLGNVAMTSVDASWTNQFGPRGMCIDQTDNTILAVFSATGGSNRAYLVKLDPTDASIIWKSVIPASDGGGPVSTGNTFSYSNITHQRIGFYTGSPATATIYNTSDGSVSNTYSTGLAGLSNIDGQCYNDSLGCVVLGLDFSNTTGSPTLLNTTPTSWGDGYAALYLAAPISTRGRRHLDQHWPVRIIP